MDTKAKASHKLIALIEKSLRIASQPNAGRRRHANDHEARTLSLFRNEEAADYYIDCAAVVPELAQLHGDHLLALISCVAQQQAEIDQLRAELRQLQHFLITTQAAKDALSEITKLVKGGKSVTNAAITLRSKGRIVQRKTAKKHHLEHSEEENLSFSNVAVALQGILSYLSGGGCFDSTALKTSTDRLKKVAKEHVETANESESQVEVTIGIGHLG